VKRALVILVASLVLASCTRSLPGTASAVGGAVGGADAVAPAAVGLLPQRSVVPPPTMRLAPGLVPPTNSWMSGLVFGPAPQPVFPLPLSVGVRADGFSIGLPRVDATAKTIFGSHTPAVDVAVGTARTEVVGYDDLTVTSSFLAADGTEAGRMLMARGSPYVRYTASTAQEVTVGAAWTDRGGWSSADVRGTTYGLTGGAAPAGGRVALTPGAILTLWALPTDGDAEELARAAAVPVTGGAATPGVGPDRVTTTLHWDTPAGAPTLVAAMPGQDTGAADCAAGQYLTIYGPMRLCLATELVVSAPRVEPADALDVSGLTGPDRAAVVDQIRRDAATVLDFTAPDTYFGGKQLARAATLLRLAEQLDVADVVTRVRAGLAARLRLWTEPDGCATRATTCFVYDPAVRGVVGLQASFGSDQFNDHYFHYGYFLYAAAVAARDDPALAADIAPVMDLVAADIGGGHGRAELPAHRAFDAYEGHSWASGFSPFADGNNQESSSEAVNAYNGLALWAQVRPAAEDPGLRDRAVWMLGAEAASATRYWTDPPLGAPEFAGFQHRVLGINWGGKRDYATWFSAEPSAALGIQLIPMGPVAGYLGGDPTRIRANLAEAAPAGYDVMFGDQLIMYLALADPAAARAAVAQLPESRIDDGDTRSYLLAWTYTRKAVS
jgi:hypothetical protein